jgi:hypothetical protein
MYRNDDEFERGQKIKLILIAVLLFLVWAANGFRFWGMLK